jgi:hypothetical protein
MRIETPGSETVKGVVLVAVSGWILGALLLVATSPDRNSSEKFGVCKRHPNGVRECLEFTEKQWRFLDNICDEP